MTVPIQLESLKRHFSELEDPRHARGRRHELVDILTIALLAMMCDCDNPEEIEEYGEWHESWLKTFLSLPHGIPTQDTYLRVLAALEPQSFQRQFRNWTSTLLTQVGQPHIAVDGKTLRGSGARGSGAGAIHMVSAWLSGAGLVLGQVKTNDKSNEINAIPELLRLLDLKDAVVTTDAMGCQRAIAEQIVEQGGHYVLAVKENQPTLYQKLVEFFADAERVQRCVDDPAPVINEHKTVDADHGRLEERTCRVSQELSWVEGRSDWRGLRTIARVESVREDLVSGKSSREYRYYISSLPHATGLGLGTIIRNHWGIENSLHWVLDVTFGEDSSRVRIGNAAENLSTIRKTALNLLKATPSTRNKKRLSIPRKRKRCSWDHDYLLDTISLVQDL